MMPVPDEWLEVHFHFEDGDYFTVDYEHVEVEYVEIEDKFREGTQKQWTITDDSVESEFTEQDVKTAMVTVKDEHRDKVTDEETPVEPGMTDDEE